MKGNKGEWSEFYTFIKLLADKKIAVADENLEKIEELFFPVLSVIRDEMNNRVKYDIQEKDKIKIIYSDDSTIVIDDLDLKTKVAVVLNEIKQGSNTITIPFIDPLIEKLQVNSLNAGNNKKEDLTLEIHDYITGIEHEMGFSIKSRLGAPATLLNASQATNFIYEVYDLSNDAISEINQIDSHSKIKDRLTAIEHRGGNLKFVGVDSDIFERNLRKMDTLMPEIISEILLTYFSSTQSTFPEILANFNQNNYLIDSFNIELTKEDFEYKVKTLLRNIALGMVPSKLWDGALRAHGGVLVVREDGEIVCYHLYNMEAFQNYLYNNTKLDSPSSSRHGYGVVYKEDGKFFIKLNLQIRFLK